jgi:hypothetical protein
MVKETRQNVTGKEADGLTFLRFLSALAQDMGI